MCMARLPNPYTDNYATYWPMFFIISTSTIITILHVSDINSKHCNVVIYKILNTWRKMHEIFVKYSLSTSIQNCTCEFWMFIIHRHYNPLYSTQVHLQQQLPASWGLQLDVYSLKFHTKALYGFTSLTGLSFQKENCYSFSKTSCIVQPMQEPTSNSITWMDYLHVNQFDRGNILVIPRPVIM